MSDSSAKKLFSHLSHELRTPLASSKLFLDMLIGGMAGDLTPQQKEILEDIDKSQAKMLEMLEEFRAEVQKLD
ncbi:MAG: histidine kinase dimerization/phospho-acceptor domain-containing protein [Patescibacteria group bacterium]